MDPIPTSDQSVRAVPPTLPSQDLQFCICRSVESLVTRAQVRCDGHIVRMDSELRRDLKIPHVRRAVNWKMIAGRTALALQECPLSFSECLRDRRLGPSRGTQKTVLNKICQLFEQARTDRLNEQRRRRFYYPARFQSLSAMSVSVLAFRTSG